MELLIERLGTTDAGSPPPPAPLRDRVLGARRRRGTAGTTSVAWAYAGTVAALDALLNEIGPGEWLRIAAYGDWTVQDLVAHLTATDGLLAHLLGIPVRPPVRADDDVASRTDTLVAQERGRPPAHTWTAWREQADTLCRWLAEATDLGEGVVSLGGPPMPLSSTLTWRAFETWIHARDIALALGRTLPQPPPEQVHHMADLGAHLLPLAAARSQVAHGGRALRLVLTGEGGGAWTVALDARGPDGGQPDQAVQLTLDVVEFCLVLADRRAPADVKVTIAGDVDLGRQVLRAAPSLAGR